MQVSYWVGVWLMMALAFTTAWVFIVKGCEALDLDDASQSEQSESHSG